MLDLEVGRGAIRIVGGMVSSQETNIVLGVTGDLSGTVLFGFTLNIWTSVIQVSFFIGKNPLLLYNKKETNV